MRERESVYNQPLLLFNSCCTPGISEFHLVEIKKVPQESILPLSMKMADVLKILKEAVPTAGCYFEAEFFFKGPRERKKKKCSSSNDGHEVRKQEHTGR